MCESKFCKSFIHILILNSTTIELVIFENLRCVDYYFIFNYCGCYGELSNSVQIRIIAL